MRTRTATLYILGLATQCLLSAASPHRLLQEVHAPLNHRHALKARHELLHQRRHAAAEPLVVRNTPTAATNTQALSSELATFTTWMNGFLGNNSNSADAVAQVKSEVQTHVSTVQSFISGVGGKVDAGSLAQLISELTVLQGWTDAWCASAPSISAGDAIAQLKNEVIGYEGWLQSWISNVSGGAPAPAAAPAPAVSSEAQPKPEANAAQSPSPSPSSTTTSATPSPSPSTTTSPAPAPSPDQQSVQQPQPQGTEQKPKVEHIEHKQVQNPEDGNYVTSSSTSSEAPYTPPTSTANAYAPPPQSPSPPTLPQAPASGNGNGYGNGNGNGNTGGDHPKLAAWWGQTAAASSAGLEQVCNDPAFDVVIIAFLTEFFGPGGYPKLDLGPVSAAGSEKQAAAGASGLVDGSALVPAIKTCQGNGKKVLLSLGGALASGSKHSGTGAPTSVFSSDAQGEQFAQTLWDLFLGGQSALRPFGDVKLDGIDIDSEAGEATGYASFASALRSKFSGDASKSYYLSAAPQCPLPDQSIPVAALQQCDFVWVQFYNNGACNHGAGSTFTDSVQQWSKTLAGSNAKLYVAAIASGNQGSGFIDGPELAKEAAEVKAMGLPNFGGYALWDASLAMQGGGMQTSLKQALS